MQKQPLEVFCKKKCSENVLDISQENNCVEVFFLLKRDSSNIYLRKSILKNICGELLLLIFGRILNNPPVLEWFIMVRATTNILIRLKSSCVYLVKKNKKEQHSLKWRPRTCDPGDETLDPRPKHTGPSGLGTIDMWPRTLGSPDQDPRPQDAGTRIWVPGPRIPCP